MYVEGFIIFAVGFKILKLEFKLCGGAEAPRSRDLN